MENALLIGMTRQMALRREMSIIANNLANINTNGYKSEHPLFEEYLMPTATEESGDKDISFVQDVGMHRNLGPGRIDVTENPLDVAISGEGYFKVQTPEGVRYTRNGAFELNAQGQLVTPDGHPVLTAGGAPITFGTDETGIIIASDGTISTSQGERGQLGLVKFENERQLQNAGGTLYRTEQAELPVEETRLMQGAIESSNVQPILEMTNMISVMQAYQSANNIVDKSDELQRRAISTLAETN
ncbi:MAG: flagellar basal-body rod protein FlgF [Rhodobiaceae bacterium]|nr:flagellar basal-body rod protein FlgF [Rhodobiaceae bacterium]